MARDDGQVGAAPIGDVVRARIREVREARRLSQGDLAAGVSALGVRMHQTTVSKVEEETRKVTIDELVAISAALDTPLPLLLAPVTQGVDVAVTPEVVVGSWEAVEWLVGARALSGTDARRWHEQTRPLRLHAEVRAAEDRAAAALVNRISHERVHDADGVQVAQRRYVEALQDLVDALEALKAAGFPVSDLESGRLVEDARDLGLKPRRSRTLSIRAGATLGDLEEALGALDSASEEER